MHWYHILIHCLVLPSLGLTQDGEELPSVCSLCSLWRDPPSSLQVSEQTPPAGHGLPSTSLRISLASVPLPAVDDGLAEAAMGPAWRSWSSTEKTQWQVCSQLARGPKEPRCIISVLLFCIVC